MHLPRWHLIICPLQVRGVSIPSAMSFSLYIFLAASTDVERAFSRGGLTVSKLRHKLKEGSVRAGTLLSDWDKQPGLIPTDKILEAFGEKRRRSKKAKTTVEGDSDIMLVE